MPRNDKMSPLVVLVFLFWRMFWSHILAWLDFQQDDKSCKSMPVQTDVWTDHQIEGLTD